MDETLFECVATALQHTLRKAEYPKGNDIITKTECEEIIAAHKALAAQQGSAMEQRFERVLEDQLATADPIGLRFCHVPPRTMNAEAPEQALWGIWEAMGVPSECSRKRAILEDGCEQIRIEFGALGEHCTAADQRHYSYIAHDRAVQLRQGNGKVRDEGHDGLLLADFCAKGEAHRAGLTRAHVLALRLYTSNSCNRINGPLQHQVKPHPYPATTFYVHDGITKLRDAYARGDLAGPQTTTFWRGLDNMAVSDAFMAVGGTLRGCMSTSTDRGVAEREFARAGRAPNPLLLKIETGNERMRCGAELAWLSMYPAEAEVLFPPLTFLKKTGEPVHENGCTVITGKWRRHRRRAAIIPHLPTNTAPRPTPVRPTFWRGRRTTSRPESYHDERDAAQTMRLSSELPGQDRALCLSGPACGQTTRHAKVKVLHTRSACFGPVLSRMIERTIAAVSSASSYTAVDPASGSFNDSFDGFYSPGRQRGLGLTSSDSDLEDLHAQVAAVAIG